MKQIKREKFQVFVFQNITLTFIQIRINMDRLFQASSNPNRLNRRVLGVPRGGESPEQKTTENPRFSRQNRNTAEQNHEEKPQTQVTPNPPRYGANRRAQNINKPQQETAKTQQNPQPQNQRYGANRRNENNRNKNHESQEDTTISSQVPNKNTGSRYSIIKRQDTKIEQQKPKQETPSTVVQPRYGTNRRTVPNTVKQEPADSAKKQESVASRRLQRKPDPTVHNETPKKEQDNFQPITARYAPVKRPSIPASQLTGEKLQEVQNIVRRPLGNQRGSAREEIPKKQETISPQQTKKQQKKTTSSFVDDFIRPVPRKGRYGQEAKQEKKEQGNNQPEVNQTPRKHLARTNQNQPNSRLARKTAEPPKPTHANENPSILSLQSNLHQNSEQSKVTEQRSQLAYKPRRGRPGSQNVVVQQAKKPNQEVVSHADQKEDEKVKEPYSYRSRGYQARKVQETTQSQTQQSSHISNPPQNKNRADLSSNISQQKSLHSHSNSRATDNLQSNFHKQAVSSFQEQTQQKKHSNILIYSLSRLSQKKMKENFNTLRINTKQVKKKDQIFTKILFNAVVNVTSKRKFQAIQILAYQVSRPEQAKLNISEIPKRLQQLTKKNKQMLPKILSCLFNHQVRSCLIKLQNNAKIKQANTKGIHALSRIENKTLKMAEEKIKQAAILKEMNRKRMIEKIFGVCKISFKTGLQQGWMKLRQNHCSKIEPSQTQNKQPQSILSPTRSPTTKKPILSPKTPQNTASILKLKKQYESDLTEFTKQKQQWNIQLNNQQQQLNILKGNCFEEEQIFEEKKQQKAILKEKISEIEIPEEDYIREENPALQDTKYSLLLDTYLVFMKNARKEFYENEELESEFPYWKKDAEEDAIVQKWKQALQNKRLKQLMEAYEGIPKLERKTALILQNQSLMITQIARSYIKQKYIWGWVKNAVANVTISM